MNFPTLRRRIQDSALSAGDKLALLDRIKTLPQDDATRAVNVALGGAVKSYATKVPASYRTK